MFCLQQVTVQVYDTTVDTVTATSVKIDILSTADDTLQYWSVLACIASQYYT